LFDRAVTNKGGSNPNFSIFIIADFNNGESGKSVSRNKNFEIFDTKSETVMPERK
jgi:hypothetical protein